MPWLSPPRTASPPRPGAAAALAPAFVTYIPPLIDGACGTVPNSQRSAANQLQYDTIIVMRMVPGLARRFATGSITALRSTSWTDMAEIAQQGVLAVIELYMLVWAVPLWFCLPGAMFATWALTCMAMVIGMSWVLNGREQVVRCTSESDGWTTDPDPEDERWFFIGGMGQSSRSLTQHTLPILAKLFNRSITAVHMPTYGPPFDLATLLLQRSFHPPTTSSRILYSQLRTSLLDPKVNRAVVLAHNTGALPTSEALARLHADIPADKMSKLEIYTFGAAASEFVMPVGGGESKKGSPLHGHAEFACERRGAPHVEHFAHASDPFAQLGVLHSVRQDLEGRFCGGVFVLNCRAAHHASSASGSTSRPLMSLNDYMCCLFPREEASSVSRESRILERKMTIDRDVAEKREFAAMAKHAVSSSSTMKKRDKRPSWTGLGATAGGMNGNMDGVDGLEMARKGCKDCDGHKGQEVSWLARYVNAHGGYLDRKSVAEQAAVGMVQ